jgi:hypothetical protein
MRICGVDALRKRNIERITKNCLVHQAVPRSSAKVGLAVAMVIAIGTVTAITRHVVPIVAIGAMMSPPPPMTATVTMVIVNAMMTPPPAAMIIVVIIGLLNE